MAFSMKTNFEEKNFEKNTGEKDGAQNVEGMPTDGDGGRRQDASDGDGHDKNRVYHNDRNDEDGLRHESSCVDVDGSHVHENGHSVEEDGMTIDDGEEWNVERDCLSRFYLKLKSFEEKLSDVQLRLKAVEEREEEKRKMASKTLEEYVENAVSSAGKFGCSRDYVRKFLKETHGMNFDGGYARTKLNRTLRKLCDDGTFKQCGNLFIWVEQ